MVDSVLRRGLRRRDVVESALQARGGCAARAWRLRCTGVEGAPVDEASRFHRGERVPFEALQANVLVDTHRILVSRKRLEPDHRHEVAHMPVAEVIAGGDIHGRVCRRSERAEFARIDDADVMSA